MQLEATTIGKTICQRGHAGVVFGLAFAREQYTLSKHGTYIILYYGSSNLNPKLPIRQLSLALIWGGGVAFGVWSGPKQRAAFRRCNCQ
jgi:hypothetical protein